MSVALIGIIYRVFGDYLRSVAGAQVAHTAFLEVGLPALTAPRLDLDYRDDAMARLLQIAATHTGLARSALLDGYAECFVSYTLARFPEFYRISANSREFLARQPTIHNCMSASLRDVDRQRAARDKFTTLAGEDSIITHYQSPNDLPDLYEALARCIIDYYGDEASLERRRLDDQVTPPLWQFHLRWAGYGTRERRIPRPWQAYRVSGPVGVVGP